MTDNDQKPRLSEDSSDRVLAVFPDKNSLADEIATRFLITLSEMTADTNRAVHIALTGGTMGIAVLAAIRVHPHRDLFDWSRVHFWWGDERWLPQGDPERNDQQARDALLDDLPVPTANIHEFPTANSGITLDDAAKQYTQELAAYAKPGALTPSFDITLLGMGPDGHVASLFPHHPEIDETGRPVVAVRNSPKPPPERLSLSLPTLNASQRVWIVVAGSEKASALSQALRQETTRNDIPASGVAANIVTFFADATAARS